jgi:hypothetical protein
MTRRLFQSALAGAAMASPVAAGPPASLAPAVRSLFLDWCGALLRLQIDAPSNPAEHGAFRCPACNFLHGRCADAVYPLLTAARLTGSPRYRQAAIRVMGWARNVDAPDGSWTNELDPKSWKGTTVFGAIALANALDRHGDLLDSGIRDEWGRRLRRAGEFIRQKFDITYGNINYPLTATHGLFLLGKTLREPEWQARARELAWQSLAYYTENRLLFGEGHPMDRISPLGCRPVDLGYNVEESLPGLLHYSRLAGDGAVLKAVRWSLRAHLAFLLPDGGWDNSWGTRSFKWTYWGSRTSDGAVPAYLGLSGEEPGFHTAAERQLTLLRRCTVDGLLHGGPHLAARGAKPCVHHTFTHVKALADVLDTGAASGVKSAPGSGEAADGVQAFPEIATWLVRRGPWRATVTRNDFLYQPGVWHPTGGAISLLHHRKAGPLLAGSLAAYLRVEAANMQLPPDSEDFPLTPRVERLVDGRTFSTLYDLNATVRAEDRGGIVGFAVEGELCDASGASGGGRVALNYRISADSVEIEASAPEGARLVLPLIALQSETVRQDGAGAVTISKTGASVEIRATGAVELRNGGRSRVFNLVPGFLAVPVTIALAGGRPVTCTLRVG